MTKKRILICGIDGYIGWAFANWLLRNRKDWEVHGLDIGLRRDLVKRVKSISAIPIGSFNDRMRYFNSKGGNFYRCYLGADEYNHVKSLIGAIKPDVILHLGEMPAAPYSMSGPLKAIETIRWNIEGTMALLWAIKENNLCSHIIKLGTMGEFGTPGIKIPEGYVTHQHETHETKHLFYRKPGSFYHSTKVADTYNVEMACRLWDFRCTDIQQGVVYGHILANRLIEETRFDFDSQFGTALNRFCMQAVSGRPITPYGAGNQKRGFLPLEDVMQCLDIVMHAPPEAGEYRSINQFDKVYSINQLASTVKNVAVSSPSINFPIEIRHVANPRKEDENHTYPVESNWLHDHGYKPKGDLEETVAYLLSKLTHYHSFWENKLDALDPNHSWTEGAL